MRKVVIHSLEEKLKLLYGIRVKRLKKYLKENMPRFNKIWEFLKEQE